MAEIKSRQATDISNRVKMAPSNHGQIGVLVISGPVTAAWAQNDTLASGVRIPKGARFLASSMAVYGAFGASVTLDVGLRNFDTGTVIDADGICAALSVASAGRSALNSGALVTAESITTEDAEVYATLAGANPTDDIYIRLEIHYLLGTA